MLKTSFILILLFLIFSCSQKKENQPAKQVLELGSILENPKKDDTVFKDIRYLKLETNPDILLGDDLYFQNKNDELYILDRAHQKSLLIFNNDGKFVQKVGAFGNGPGEYPAVNDFVFRNDTIDVLSNAGPKSTIYSYSEKGDFISKKQLNYLALSFEFVHHQYYAVYTSFNKMMHDHRLYLLDREGNEIKKLLPNNTKIDMPVGEQSFGLYEDRVLYFEPFNNKVFKFQTDTIIPVYELNFGKYNMPEEFFNTDIMKGFEIINKQGFSNIKNVFENKENMVFELSRQKEEEPSNLFLITFNKKSGEIKHLTLTEDNYIFRYPIGINDKNEMMYLVFSMGDVNQDFKKYGLNVNITNFTESENPIVVFCKI
jgi:hypothetical protein